MLIRVIIILPRCKLIHFLFLILTIKKKTAKIFVFLQVSDRQATKVLTPSFLKRDEKLSRICVSKTSSRSKMNDSAESPPELPENGRKRCVSEGPKPFVRLQCSPPIIILVLYHWLGNHFLSSGTAKHRGKKMCSKFFMSVVYVMYVLVLRYSFYVREQWQVNERHVIYTTVLWSFQWVTAYSAVLRARLQFTHTDSDLWFVEDQGAVRVVCRLQFPLPY